MYLKYLYEHKYKYGEILNKFFNIEGKQSITTIARYLGVDPSTIIKYIKLFKRMGFTFGIDIAYARLGLRRVYIFTNKKVKLISNRQKFQVFLKTFARSLCPSGYFIAYYIPWDVSVESFVERFATNNYWIVEETHGSKPDLIKYNIPPQKEEDLIKVLNEVIKACNRYKKEKPPTTSRSKLNSIDLTVIKELEKNYFTKLTDIARRSNIPYHRILARMKKINSYIECIRVNETPWTRDVNQLIVAIMSMKPGLPLRSIADILCRLPMIGNVNISWHSNSLILLTLPDLKNMFILLDNLVSVGIAKRYSTYLIEYPFKSYTLPYKVGVEYNKYQKKWNTFIV